MVKLLFGNLNYYLTFLIIEFWKINFIIGKTFWRLRVLTFSSLGVGLINAIGFLQFAFISDIQ